jgi:hypothetical protein
MPTLGGKRVLIGGFHDHWLRNGTDNPALLLAALTWYHYDFMCLMDGEDAACRRFAAQVEAWLPGVRIHPGYERTFGFGHVVTVACDAPPIAPDRRDYDAVLRELRARSGFTALAHPDFPVTNDLILRSGELHRLLDQGCMDAVEVTPDPELLAFIDERNRRGLPIPVIAGWDIHEVTGRPDQLPPVLYTPGTPPEAQIDTVGHDRTWVVCEENTLPAVRAAVAAGWSAVELVHERRLVGPRQAVDWLEANGWRAAADQLDRRRGAARLDLPDGHGRVGRPLRLRFDRPGRVRVPGTFDRPRELALDADGTVALPALPALLDRDSTHLPVVHIDTAGVERAFAVRLDHAAGVDLVPLLDPAGPQVEVRPRLPFAGPVRVSFAGAPAVCAGVGGPPPRLALPLPAPGCEAVPYALEAEDGHGTTRRDAGLVTFLPAPRFHGSWRGIPGARIDRAELCGGYGSNRPYPGPEVFAGRWRFAWDEQALLMDVRITDAVYFNNHRGHMMYQADCIQFGLDPLLRRDQDMGSCWAYTACLGPDGPELFRWRAARALVPVEAAEDNVSLGGEHLAITPWAGGLDYRLRLPWALLAPAAPRAGAAMGLFLHLFNNDGGGLLDAMQWPRATRGMWTIPRTWGQLTLVDAVPAWLAGDDRP